MVANIILSMAFFWVAGASVPLTGAPDPEMPVVVKGSRVNLRAGAALTFEVVHQVQQGQPLIARSFEGEWVEVVPPEGCSVWVHRDFIEDGRVSAADLNVRAGPGSNYSVVGSIPRGTTVESISEHGEWLQTKPFPGCTFWISKEFVELIMIPRRAPPAEPEVPKPDPVAPVSTHQPEPPPEPEPPPLELVPLDGQGDMAVMEGELRLTDQLFGRPAAHRLVESKGLRRRTVCYVHGNQKQLSGYLGRRMKIEGRQYWAKDIKFPVLVPEKITIRKK
jgi:uncharacterized protein YraI